MMNIEITDCRLVKEFTSIVEAIALLIPIGSMFDVRSSRFEILVFSFYIQHLAFNPPSLRYGRAGI